MKEFSIFYILLLLLLLSFISFINDNAFSFENKTLLYIFDPFLKLKGTDYYNLKSNNQLQLEEFTVATWFRTNQSSFDEPAHIVNKGGFNNERPGKNMNYGVWMNTDGTITAGFESDSGKNVEILSPKKYNDGKWHYVIVFYNSTVLRMDIDGRTIENLETSRTPDTTGNQPLRVGANSLDLDKYFNGDVDEIRIWNRALQINELNEIYTNRNFATSGQVEYLNFGNYIIEDNKERIDNATKQELPIAKPTIEPTKPTIEPAKPTIEPAKPTIEPAKPITKPNVTKEELPTAKVPTIKKQQQPPIVEPQIPSKPNVTKEELPIAKPNVTKEELPKAKETKQQIPITKTKKKPTKKISKPNVTN